MADMGGTLARLGYAREIQASRAAIDSDPKNIKRTVALQRKIVSLRALLLGQGGTRVEDLDLFNAAQAIPILSGYIDTLKDASPIEKGIAASYLSTIITHLGDTARAQTKDYGNPPEIDELAFKVQRLKADLPSGDALKAELFNQYHEAGQEAYEHADRLNTLMLEFAAANEAARNRTYEDEITAISLRIAEISDKINNTVWTDPEDEEMTALFEARKAYFAELNAVRAAAEQVAVRRTDEAFAARERIVEAGKAIRQAILDASPVTAEQAEAWAAGQTITEAAAARLRKSGYPPDQVRADMAEFYRMTGGRLASMAVDSDGGKRANATNIHGYQQATIRLGNSFDRRVLWHELAHHLEADPAAREAANGFLLARRKSDEPKKLRKLTGSALYGADEIAYEDDFFNAYVGKVYSDESTEVFSMGIESFSHPETLAMRMVKDPEMFALMTGFLKTPPNPLAGVVQRVYSQVNEAETQIQQSETVEREIHIKKLADSIAIVNNPEWFDEWKFSRSLLYYYKGARYLGSVSDTPFLIFWCKSIRDLKTKRILGAGYLVAYSSDHSYRVDRYFGGIEELKATIRVWIDQGFMPQDMSNLNNLRIYAEALK
jgi:hypothetical protein